MALNGFDPNGHVADKERRREYGERHGLCTICNKYQTHKRTGFLGNKWEPLTSRDEEGNFTVYKGYCIQPTCYTLQQAKQMAGEEPRRPRGMDDSSSSSGGGQGVGFQQVAPAPNSGNGGGWTPGVFDPHRAQDVGNGRGYGPGNMYNPQQQQQQQPPQQQQQQPPQYPRGPRQRPSDPNPRANPYGRNYPGGGGGGRPTRFSVADVPGNVDVNFNDPNQFGGFDDNNNINNNNNFNAGGRHPNDPRFPPNYRMPSAQSSQQTPQTTGYQNRYPSGFSGQPNQQRGYNNQQQQQQQQGYANQERPGYGNQPAGYNNPQNGYEPAGYNNRQQPPRFQSQPPGHQNPEPAGYQRPQQRQPSAHPDEPQPSGYPGERPYYNEPSAPMATRPGPERTNQRYGGQNDGGNDASVLQELEQLASAGDFIGFFGALENRGESPWVVQESLTVLTQHVARYQADRGPNGVILAGDRWVKTINSKLRAFKANKDVMGSGLMALGELLTMNDRHRKGIIKWGSVEIVLDAMENFHGDYHITKIGTSILEGLCRDRKGKLSGTYKGIAVVVRKLADIAMYEQDEARALAFRALFNLSRQRKEVAATGRTIMYDIRNSLDEKATLDALTATLQSDQLDQAIAEACASLVWRLSVTDESNTEFIGVVPLKLVEGVTAAAERFDSRPLHEATCGAFANLSLKDGFPAAGGPVAAKTICGSILRSEASDDERLGLCALHAVCNLLSDPERANMITTNSPEVVEEILALMRRYNDSEELQEHGCLAIAHATRDQGSVQDMVVQMQGLELTMSVLSNHVLSKGEFASMSVKDASLSAILELTKCRRGVQAATQAGLFHQIQTMLFAETDAEFQTTMQAILSNQQQNFAPQVDRSAADVLRRNPERFPELMRRTNSAQEAALFIRSLRELGPAVMGRLGDGEYGAVMSAMQQYRDSTEVQIQGCVMMAESFVAYGNFRPNSPLCASLVPVIAEAMIPRYSDASLVEPASVLMGCIVPTLQREAIIAARPSLSQALVSTIQGNTQNLKVQIHLVEALEWCCKQDGYFREQTSHQSTIQAIIRAMNDHQDSADLQRNACRLLRIIGSDVAGKEVIGQQGGVLAVVGALRAHGESPAVAKAALLALKSLSMARQNKHRIAQAGAEEAILHLMWMHIETPDVLSGAFAALNNMVVESETRTVAPINQDILASVVEAMRRFQTHEELQTNACFLLKSCTYLESNVRLFRAYEDELIPLLLSDMETFPRGCSKAASGILARLQKV